MEKDDNNNTIIDPNVKRIDNAPKVSKEELLEIVNDMVERIQRMSVDQMLIPLNHADLSSILFVLLSAIRLL